MGRAQGVAILLILLVPAACAGLFRGKGVEAVSLDGAGSASWGALEATPNFTWKYETVARAGRDANPYHRMLTELTLAYDPEAGEILAAKLTSGGRAGNERTIVLTPSGSLLRIHVSTLLDPAAKNRTVLRIGGPIAVGVGPGAGLAEVIQVKFERGEFRVLPDTGAHLAGANVTVDRRMTQRPGATDPVSAQFP